MTDKAISKRSLQNLTQFNQEARQVARESMEIALLTLLEKKPLGDITISELVTKAGVSRNAFYRNYNSKEAILEHLLTTMIRRIFHGLKQFDVKTQAYQAWLYLFNEAKKEAQPPAHLAVSFFYRAGDCDQILLFYPHSAVHGLVQP